MSRWIDADAWCKAVQKHYTDGDCADDDRYELGINVGITKSRNVMMSAPSIDIVHCRECKYWRSTVQMPNGTEVKCLYGRKPDDFCSYGQKGDENVETD